jgi:hypothetical protein
MQDDAATTADAAVPPMQTDAGAVDGGVRDSGAALDAQAQVDAALADANDYDADAGSHDADASTHDADAASQGGDAASADGGALDSGANLDAQAPLDASTADASHDTGASPDAGNDAGKLVRARSGEVRWVVKEAQGSLFCPQQSQLLWKDEIITLNDPSSRGFKCDICPNPPFDDSGTSTYYLQSDELDIRFDFFSSITRGYSLAAFRDGLRFVTVRWKTAPKSATKEGWTQFSTWSDQPTVEFLSYAAPLLHVRLQATVYETAISFTETATAPYVCFHSPPTPFPDICTEVACGFRSGDLNQADPSPANGVHVTIDVTLPVEAPHEGLSPP